MKNAVKIIVDNIEKEIISIIESREIERSDYRVEKDFDFGRLTYDVGYNEKEKRFQDDWDMKPFDIEIEIKVKSIEITNENSKVLTNLSNEVFNQLEEVYTNY